MKLSKAESQAVKFIIFIVALSAFARWRGQPETTVVETARMVGQPLAETPRPHSKSGPIDPNTASLADLDRLPGIGRVTAAKVIEHRPYRDLGELAKVIGTKRALQLEARLTLRRGSGFPTEHSPKKALRENAESQRVEPPAPAGPIPLNRATASQLEALPGVGPALAARIAARRDSLRGFRSWEQVDSVTGIGPALLRKIKMKAVL